MNYSEFSLTRSCTVGFHNIHDFCLHVYDIQGLKDSKTYSMARTTKMPTGTFQRAETNQRFLDVHNWM